MRPSLPLTDELAGLAARTSGLLLSTRSAHSALRSITAAAAETFPSAMGAGVSLMSPDGERTSAAATDAAVLRADDLQYESGQGPCLSAWEQHGVVHVPDVTVERRWPEWSAAAAEIGVRSVLSAALVTGARSLGALKVYGAEAGLFGGHEEHLLELFADQAATLLLHVRTADDARRISDDLKRSLRTRDVISLAKGMLMAREGVAEGAAFLLLANAARDRGETVAEAAERMVGGATREPR